MIIKPIVTHGLPLFIFPVARPDIAYLHQKIPSDYGMPAFDYITAIAPNVYSNTKYCTVNSSTDMTGARFEQYAKLVIVAHKMKIFCHVILFWCTKFQFQNEDRYESMIELRVIDLLKPLNKKAMDDRPSG